MPFVRTARDKRGYEHIYLIDTPVKRGRPSASRVLYWFRTPPGVKVGREPFDDATRRALEGQYPNLIFDWKKLANTPMPPPDAEHWRERRRLERSVRQAHAAEGGEDEVARAATPAEDVDAVVPGAEVEAGVAGGARAADIVDAAEVVAGVDVVPVVGGAATGAAAVTALEPRRRRRRGGRRRRGKWAARGTIPVAAVSGTALEIAATPDPDSSTLDPHEEE